MRPELLIAILVVALGLPGIPVFGADEAIIKPLVPIDQIEEARTWTNPLPATEETIEKGKTLFQGKPSASLATGETAKDWAATLSRAR